MPTREKVPQPMKSGLRGELVGILVGELDLTHDDARRINLGQFRKDAREFFAKYRSGSTELSSDLLRWQGVYEKLFGKTPDLSQVVVPEKPEGFGPMRLVVVARELAEWTTGNPLQGTQDALKKHFPTWQYESDLDNTITGNSREPKNGSYALWVRDVREADEEFANKSANDLAAMNHVSITVLERQLMEADYFWERGEHLDIQNITLCAGSRRRDGGVPGADWYGGEFRVFWYDAARRRPSLRSRRVWM